MKALFHILIAVLTFALCATSLCVTAADANEGILQYEIRCEEKGGVKMRQVNEGDFKDCEDHAPNDGSCSMYKRSCEDLIGRNPGDQSKWKFRVNVHPYSDDDLEDDEDESYLYQDNDDRDELPDDAEEEPPTAPGGSEDKNDPSSEPTPVDVKTSSEHSTPAATSVATDVANSNANGAEQKQDEEQGTTVTASPDDTVGDKAEQTTDDVEETTAPGAPQGDSEGPGTRVTGGTDSASTQVTRENEKAPKGVSRKRWDEKSVIVWTNVLTGIVTVINITSFIPDDIRNFFLGSDQNVSNKERSFNIDGSGLTAWVRAPLVLCIALLACIVLH